MAQITPPIGFNLFVLQGMTRHPDRLYRAHRAPDVRDHGADGGRAGGLPRACHVAAGEPAEQAVIKQTTPCGGTTGPRPTLPPGGRSAILHAGYRRHNPWHDPKQLKSPDAPTRARARASALRIKVHETHPEFAPPTLPRDRCPRMARARRAICWRWVASQRCSCPRLSAFLRPVLPALVSMVLALAHGPARPRRGGAGPHAPGTPRPARRPRASP